MNEQDLVWALLEQNKALIDQNMEFLRAFNRLLSNNKMPLASLDEVEPDLTFYSTDNNEYDLGEYVEGEVFVDADLIEEAEREMENEIS